MNTESVSHDFLLTISDDITKEHSKCAHSECTVRMGKLKALRTVGEVQASNATIEAYIVEIPAKSASTILELFNNAVRFKDSTNLQHLRRFARSDFLPEHLKRKDLSTSIVPTLHLLICSTSSVTPGELQSLVSSYEQLFHPIQAILKTIPVPLFAPTSAVQAADWSSKYWPIVYKNTNPYGPHPAMVARAQVELMAKGEADWHMSLAQTLGCESANLEQGEAVGAVIVERINNRTKVVAVAGDSRYQATKPGKCGNPMGHAVMRAIGFVARKRQWLEQKTSRSEESQGLGIPTSAPETALAIELPSTAMEKYYFNASDTLAPNGYLCLDLELYITHEPCVMCSMAILHSRFGRVIFRRLLPKTGALSAEVGGLGYGLFWREQLNWKLLCWQWETSEEETAKHDHDGSTTNDDIHA